MAVSSLAVSALVFWLVLLAPAGNVVAEMIQLPGGQLQVLMPPSVTDSEQRKLIRWLTTAGRAVTQGYGLFPLDRVGIQITPVSRGQGPVPFGRVLRNGGTRVELFVKTGQPLSVLTKDWTVVHEFSHLMLPHLHRESAWLAEGIATYYQSLLRVRAGLISEEDAWNSILAGLKRGRQDTRSAQTLRQTSASMSRKGGFMRVYWSGLVYALTTDLQLRRESNGQLSLDRALYKFRNCCLPTDHRWRGAEFVAQLDALLETDHFTSGFAAYSGRRDFPKIKKPLEQLGVIDQAGQLRLDNHAPDAAIRYQIMHDHPDFSVSHAD